ncbi:MAG: hypothetical protein ACO3L9_04880 [Aquiluna sp.]|nr:hypothetical protein [Actinomycetota bacterium]
MKRDREELIQWLRNSKPETVVGEIAKKLEDGVSTDELWAIGALTASRYVSNQARNLLGFVSHAMIGCEDARAAADQQPESIQRLMLIQALSQVVMDLQDPCFAPYELSDVWGIEEATVDQSIALLRSDVRFGEWLRADHRLVGLERKIPRAELIDLILDIGLEGIVTDDHTLITPALSLDMMELTGWEDGFAMLRGTIRYSCTFPRNFGPYDLASSLVDEFELAESLTQGAEDPILAEQLRVSILEAKPADRPRLVASSLASGISAETMMSALSLAACDMYLQVEPVPHDDYDAVSREVAPIHIGTTLNILRASLSRMFRGTAARAVVMGGCLLERGPSILNEDFEFIAFEPGPAYPRAEDVEAARSKGTYELLEELEKSLYSHDVALATASVKAYELASGDPEELITLLVRVACTDDGTLMHNVKHLHSCLGEFRASSNPDRWNFLISAAKWVSWYAGKNTKTYERAVGLISA